jgi:O-antigen/teichoic acid export membrane protein
MLDKELSTLLKHSTIYGSSIVFGQAISFLLLPVYTRYLSPSDYGLMTLVNVSIDLIGLVAGLGIEQGMARFYSEGSSEDEKNLVVSTSYWMWAAATTLGLPLVYASSHSMSRIVFDSDSYGVYFRIAALSLFLSFGNTVGLLWFMLQRRPKAYSIISLSQSLLTIGLNIYFIVYQGTGVIGIFYASLISRSIAAIFLSSFVLSRVGARFGKTVAANMLRYSYPLVFSNVFRELVNQSDKYFINYFFSPFETGIYSLANKIGGSVHTVITSAFLRSYIARRFEIAKQSDAGEIYGRVLKAYLVGIGSAGLVLSLFSREIIQAMTTPEYYEASIYIPLVVLSMIVFGLRYHFETGILLSRKTQYIAWVNGISAVINVVSNYLLVPRLKLWGALLSSIVSYASADVLLYILSYRLFRVNFDIGFVIKFVAWLASLVILALVLPTSDMLETLALKSALIAGYVVLTLAYLKAGDLRQLFGFK